MTISAVRNALPALRRAAESLMTDHVCIERLTGVEHVDPDTGIVLVESETVYDGKCKVQTAGGIAQQSIASATGETSNLGGVVPLWSLYLHLPMDATGPRTGDIALIHSTDPVLDGMRCRLLNLQSEKTHATARRWNVQQIPKGE